MLDNFKSGSYIFVVLQYVFEVPSRGPQEIKPRLNEGNIAKFIKVPQAHSLVLFSDVIEKNTK